MKDERISKIISAGSELVGALAGAGAAMYFGDPGSLASGVMGVVISKGILEVSTRYLSNRETVRVGAASIYMINGYEERIQKGDQPRNDGFYKEGISGRSKAEELFEGALLKCKIAYEENKIKYISKLFVNVSFDQTVNPVNANQILYVSEQLPYQHFLLMEFFKRNKDNCYGLQLEDYHDMGGIPESIVHQYLLQDILTLSTLGLVESNDGNTFVTGIEWIAPSKIILSAIGAEVCRLLGLEEIEESEFEFKTLLL